MGELVLYGLTAAGDTLFTEALPRTTVVEARATARSHLGRAEAVEIWDGPLSLVRLRRETPGVA